MRGKSDNLVGRKSGKLKVVSRAGSNKRGESLWNCRCKCGNTCVVKGRNLKTRKTKSCGCLKSGPKRKECVVGKKFHHLTITKYLHSDKFRESVYAYQCECGHGGTIRQTQIGRTHSCPHCRWNAYKDITHGYWSRIKRDAKTRNLEFAVTPAEAWAIFTKQNGKCALSGVELQFARTHTKKQTASLDRIDSSKGYTKHNIQWVHKKVNELKWDLTTDELIGWCKLIVKEANRVKNDHRSFRSGKCTTTSKCGSA